MKMHVADLTKEKLEEIKEQLEKKEKDFREIAILELRIPETEHDALMDRLIKEVGYQRKD